MPILPPPDDHSSTSDDGGEGDFGEAFGFLDDDRLSSNYDPLWVAEELAVRSEVNRRKTEDLLGFLRTVYGFLLPLIHVLSLVAFLCIVFFDGFNLYGFNVSETMEVIALSTATGAASTSAAIIMWNLFSTK